MDAALHERLRARGVAKLGARLSIITALSEPTVEALDHHLATIEDTARQGPIIEAATSFVVVVHKPSILVRGERSTSSPYVLSYRTGDEIEIVADGEVDGWLRLTNQRGWVLRDGAHLGFGLLVVPLPPLTARSELAALPPLTVRAVDGLCNRLRVVLSYAAVARRHGRRLLVWWPLINVCDGRFTDAFMPLEGVSFVEDIGDFPDGLVPSFSPASHDFHPLLKAEGEQACTSAFEALTPNAVVGARVAANVGELRAPPFEANGFVALHIRRTDHWGSQLTDDDFGAFVRAHPSHAVYLATDNAITQQKFVGSAEHGHRVRAYTRIVADHTRLRQTSLADAAVDIFTAAAADGPFMGCYSSSFSDTILRLRQLAGKAARDRHELTDAQMQMGVTVCTPGGHRDHSPGMVMETARFKPRRKEEM